MADIDKTREVARNIEQGIIIADPHGDARILADGFLALDKLLETHPPAEKPEHEVDVLITFVDDSCTVGTWGIGEVWVAEDSIYPDTDIKHWQHLPTPDKK